MVSVGLVHQKVFDRQRWMRWLVKSVNSKCDGALATTWLAGQAKDFSLPYAKADGLYGIEVTVVGDVVDA